MAAYENFDDLVSSNRLFVYHGGYYFTLNGDFYSSKLPKGNEPIDLLSVSSLDDQSIISSLAPELELATVIYEREVNNPESKFLLSQGTTYILDVGEGRIARCVKGFVHESELGAEGMNWIIKGVTSTSGNYISVDKTEYSDSDKMLGASEFKRTGRTFREESTHMLDLKARLNLGIRDHNYGLSHNILSDEVRRASIDRMKALDPDYNSFELLDTLFNGAKTDKPILDQLYEEYGLGSLDPNQSAAVGLEAPHQAYYVHRMLEGLLALDSYAIGSCDETASEEKVTIKDASDDHSDRGKNAIQDAEVIAKLHVLRMELEDMIASVDGSYQPDYYSPESRATKVLKVAVPELMDVYSGQWLPIITIMTRVETPELKELLLRSHAASGVVDGVGEGKAGEITAAEQRALRQAIAMQNPDELNLVGLEDLEDNSNGYITIGDVNIPVTFTEASKGNGTKR